MINIMICIMKMYVSLEILYSYADVCVCALYVQL